MIALGVVGAERREYWRLLGWTMRYKRSLLALAVRLAAIGHHHRHMTEKVLADLARSQEAPIAVAIEPSIATPVRTGT
jgi:hypothetical protein